MAWRDDRLAPADIAGYPVSRVNPVEWTILAEHGIRLRGPDADTIGIHQDRDELTAWNLRILDTHWRRTARLARDMPREAAAAFEARTITWMIFGPLRAHYAIATGHIATKAKASEYALTWLPTRWDGLIHDALAIERGVRQRLLRRTASSGIGEPTSDAHRRDRP